MDAIEHKPKKVSFVQRDDGNVVGPFRKRRKAAFQRSCHNFLKGSTAEYFSDIQFDKLIVVLYLKMELEKLGISKLSYSLQTYLKRSMFKSAREDEMRDDKEDSILDTARTVSSIQLVQKSSFEEEMSEDDLIEAELERMELELSSSMH